MEYLLAKVDRIQNYYNEDDLGPYDLANSRLIQSLCNNTKSIFDRLTEADCSVCIKQYYEPNFDPALLASMSDFNGPAKRYVRTYRRDRLSSDNRRGGNQQVFYSVGDNTAFERILAPQAMNNYFISNDLRAMGDGYRNGNPSWKQFYNATVVVPIKATNLSMEPAVLNEQSADRYAPTPISDKDIEERIVGFLCVDSKEGRFDELASIRIIKRLHA